MKDKIINTDDIPGCPEQYKGKQIVLRKLTYGDENEAIDRMIEVDIRTMKPTGSFQFGKLRNLAIIYGVESAPFFEGENINWAKGLNDVQFNNRMFLTRNIPPEIGNFLFQEIVMLNPSLVNRTEDDIKNSLSSSEEKAGTQKQPSD